MIMVRKTRDGGDALEGVGGGAAAMALAAAHMALAACRSSGEPIATLM